MLAHKLIYTCKNYAGHIDKSRQRAFVKVLLTIAALYSVRLEVNRPKSSDDSCFVLASLGGEPAKVTHCGMGALEGKECSLTRSHTHAKITHGRD